MILTNHDSPVQNPDNHILTQDSAFHQMERSNSAYNLCLECGKDVHQIPGRKRKKFCCDDCRSKWWKRNRWTGKGVTPIEEETRVCPTCGKIFFDYGHADRKYCSHECYIAYRFNDASVAGTGHGGQPGGALLSPDSDWQETVGNLKTEGKDISREELSAYLENPYIKSATEEKIVPDDSFFHAAYPLLEVGIDKVLSTFEMNPEHFSPRQKTYFITSNLNSNAALRPRYRCKQSHHAGAPPGAPFYVCRVEIRSRLCYTYPVIG